MDLSSKKNENKLVMLKIKNKKGLSLIEVVTVVGVIGIMTAITIVAFTNSRRIAALNAEAEVIVAAIREAQNYALTGKSISKNGNCYRYGFYASGSQFAVRNGDGTCSSGINKIYAVNNGVSISGTPSYTFDAPHATFGSSGTITTGVWSRMKLIKGTDMVYICVNSTGLVKKTSSSACN